MPPEPVSPDPAPSCPDWMDDPAYLAMRAADTDPGDLDLGDPDDDPPPAPGPRPPAGRWPGMIPPGFSGQVTLTIPEATLAGRADRPGELGLIGRVDPDPEANTPDRYRFVT